MKLETASKIDDLHAQIARLIQEEKDAIKAAGRFNDFQLTFEYAKVETFAYPPQFRYRMRQQYGGTE